eukprot:4719165-Amphidinium_carterae.1
MALKACSRHTCGRFTRRPKRPQRASVYYVQQGETSPSPDKVGVSLGALIVGIPWGCYKSDDLASALD